MVFSLNISLVFAPIAQRNGWELAVTLFTDLIRKEADGGKATGTIFIDLSKAFDTISHSVLLEKLSRYGIQDNELNWFTDYYFIPPKPDRSI